MKTDSKNGECNYEFHLKKNKSWTIEMSSYWYFMNAKLKYVICYIFILVFYTEWHLIGIRSMMIVLICEEMGQIKRKKHKEAHLYICLIVCLLHGCVRCVNCIVFIDTIIKYYSWRQIVKLNHKCIKLYVTWQFNDYKPRERINLVFWRKKNK